MKKNYEWAIEWQSNARAYAEVKHLGNGGAAVREFMKINEYSKGELKLASKRFSECKKDYDLAVKDYGTFEKFELYFQEKTGFTPLKLTAE